MANIRSMKKDLRRNEKRRLRNQVTKSAIKTFVRRVRTAIKGGDPVVTGQEMKIAVSVIDKAYERGIIHRNTAARRKSRLMKAANKMVPVGSKS